MKVSDNPSGNKEYLKRLDDSIRNQTINKEAELQKIKEIYDRKIEATKTEGEDQYINSLKKNDGLIEVASKDYESKLSNYRDNLSHTQKTVEQEELAIKADHQEKLKNQKDQFQNSFYDQFQNAHENQADIQNQTQNSLRDLTDKIRSEKIHLQTTGQAEVNALAQEFNLKEATTERDFRAKMDADIRSQQEAMALQKTELKKAMNKSTDDNKRLETEKNRVQSAELNYLDRHQKDMIDQKTADFKIRYENLVKEHQTLIDELKTHFESDVKKLAEQNASQKRILASKAEDQFYRIETIKPNITETEKDYQVSLRVPEHEKENVHLSAHGRGVKMTLSRKYVDSMEDIDGSTNRSSRTELFSKEFASKDLLNPKLITQKYQDGVLTFNIQKL